MGVWYVTLIWRDRTYPLSDKYPIRIRHGYPLDKSSNNSDTLYRYVGLVWYVVPILPSPSTADCPSPYACCLSSRVTLHGCHNTPARWWCGPPLHNSSCGGEAMRSSRTSDSTPCCCRRWGYGCAHARRPWCEAGDRLAVRDDHDAGPAQLLPQVSLRRPWHRDSWFGAATGRPLMSSGGSLSACTVAPSEGR